MNALSSRAFFAVGKFYSLDVSVFFGPVSAIQTLRLRVEQETEWEFIVECKRLLPSFFEALRTNLITVSARHLALSYDSTGWYEYDDCYLVAVLSFVRSCNSAWDQDDCFADHANPFVQLYIE